MESGTYGSKGVADEGGGQGGGNQEVAQQASAEARLDDSDYDGDSEGGCSPLTMAVEEYKDRLDSTPTRELAQGEEEYHDEGGEEEELQEEDQELHSHSQQHQQLPRTNLRQQQDQQIGPVVSLMNLGGRKRPRRKTSSRKRRKSGTCRLIRGDTVYFCVNCGKSTCSGNCMTSESSYGAGGGDLGGNQGANESKSNEAGEKNSSSPSQQQQQQQQQEGNQTKPSDIAQHGTFTAQPMGDASALASGQNENGRSRWLPSSSFPKRSCRVRFHFTKYMRDLRKYHPSSWNRCQSATGSRNKSSKVAHDDERSECTVTTDISTAAILSLSSLLSTPEPDLFRDTVWAALVSKELLVDGNHLGHNFCSRNDSDARHLNKTLPHLVPVAPPCPQKSQWDMNNRPICDPDKLRQDVVPWDEPSPQRTQSSWLMSTLSITIEQALTFSPQARLLLQSQVPYPRVHHNAAYELFCATRGSSSGGSLTSRAAVSTTSTTATGSFHPNDKTGCCSDNDSTNSDRQQSYYRDLLDAVHDLFQGRQQGQHHVMVYPVWSAESNMVTHYLLELESVLDANNNNGDGLKHPTTSYTVGQGKPPIPDSAVHPNAFFPVPFCTVG